MNGEPFLADSRRLRSLRDKFQDKQYRDGYVAAQGRRVLAEQMRNFRGDRSQTEYAESMGKQKTQIARFENPAYGGWSLSSMLEMARKNNVALFVRFVDFPTFLKYSSDLSDAALWPALYDQQAIDGLVHRAEIDANANALKGLFSNPRKVQTQHHSPSARDAMGKRGGFWEGQSPANHNAAGELLTVAEQRDPLSQPLADKAMDAEVSTEAEAA
jgi:hypothetical protein